MRFAFPWALTLLALSPVLLALALREESRRRARLRALGDARLLLSLSEGVSPRRRRIARASAIAAWALLVVALAGPQWGERTELLPRRGLDVVFALDVSRSMQARDVLPDRLQRAKAEISASLERLGENRVGIVAFAGTAFVQCPLTTDLDAVRLFLKGLDPSVVPQGGTALGLGLRTALDLFRAEAEGQGAAPAGRVLVVVTDGEDHEGGVEGVASELKQEGVTVVMIGVGGGMGEPIPIVDEHGRVSGYQKDRAGKTIMSRMSPAVLEAAAAAAGGTFLDGTSRPDLGMGEVQARLAVLEKRDLEARIRTEYVDRSSWPAALGLVLLLLAVVVPEGARRPSFARRSS